MCSNQLAPGPKYLLMHDNSTTTSLNLTLCIFYPGTYAEQIFQVYSQEMSLRESIVGDILQQKERDTLTVYLSCWLHQPYISSESNDQLEAMLMECGLRE